MMIDWAEGLRVGGADAAPGGHLMGEDVAVLLRAIAALSSEGSLRWHTALTPDGVGRWELRFWIDTDDGVRFRVTSVNTDIATVCHEALNMLGTE